MGIMQGTTYYLRLLNIALNVKVQQVELPLHTGLKPQFCYHLLRLRFSVVFLGISKLILRLDQRCFLLCPF